MSFIWQGSQCVAQLDPPAQSPKQPGLTLRSSFNDRHSFIWTYSGLREYVWVFPPLIFFKGHILMCLWPVSILPVKVLFNRMGLKCFCLYFSVGVLKFVNENYFNTFLADSLFYNWCLVFFNEEVELKVHPFNFHQEKKRTKVKMTEYKS